jgi:hypothetical protein
MRAIRPWRRSRSTASRAASFVAAIVARHGHGLATLFGPERVMRRSRAAAALSHHHHLGDTLTFAPRFNIRIEPVVRTRAAPAALLPWRETAARDAPLPARASAQISMMQRIFAREQRVHSSETIRETLREILASTPTPGPASIVAEPPRPRVKPVVMLVRHPPTALKDPTPPPSRAPAPVERDDRHPAVTIFRPAAQHAPPGLSPIELGRVTDHVVRALDRRLTAQRERQGRI